MQTNLVLLVLVCVSCVHAADPRLNYTVTGTLPPQGGIDGGDDITVQGDGFYYSLDIKCSFIHSKDNYQVNGTFVSDSKVQCTTPSVKVSGNYYIEVSEDGGARFTDNKVIFLFTDPQKSDGSLTLLMGIIIIVIIFSLTTTAVGIYFWRKKKEKKQDQVYAEQSFSLLPGMSTDPRRNEL